MNSNINWKKLLVCIAIPLLIGALSGLLIRNHVSIYETLRLPALAPPGWLFPIVWTVLYFLMGISSYLIIMSEDPDKKDALQLYAIQLALNFIWSPIFFNLQNYLLAFMILVLLWYFIVQMIMVFRPINQTAAKLQIPYLLWVTFAGYLNLSIYLMNR